MSSSSIKVPKQKANEESHEHQNESIDIGEDSKKNNTKESENEKPLHSEVVLNIEESMQENLKTGYCNKNFLLYECRSNPERTRKKVPTTLVYIGQHLGIEPSGPPLDYDPDRNHFVRIVMILVFLMTATTAVCVAIVLFVEDLKEFCQDNNTLIFFAGAIISFGMTYAIACSSCTRTFPCNIISLFITVIGMTLICVCITVRYKTEIVLMAVAATAGIVFICFLIAMSNFDFTSFILYIVGISCALMMVGIIFIIYMMVTGHYMKWVHFGILTAFTILNCVVLIMELQMILGGKAVQLSEDDYALGAFMVYTSIIDIFIKLVQIIGILDS